MSVKIRPYRKGGWEVDIHVVTPDGKRSLRERRRAQMSARSAAVRWAEGRERVCSNGLSIRAGHTQEGGAHLTSVRAEIHRRPRHGESAEASSIAAKNAILRLYLIPTFGRRRLDAIKNEDVQRLKAQLELKSPKTVNNVLNVLSVLLKKAVEWEVIDRMPCTVKLLRVQHGTAAFHDFDAVRTARRGRAIDRHAHAARGAARRRRRPALRRDHRARMGDVDLAKRQLCVRQSDWNGQLGTPKSGRLRYVPLTQRLTAALVEHRHLRSKRVLCQADGSAVHAADRAEPDDPRGEASEREEGRAHPSSHVLLALVDARRAGAGDSGARRPRGPDDDAALHAPESGGADCGDSAAGSSRSDRDSTSWRSLETGETVVRSKNR